MKKSNTGMPIAFYMALLLVCLTFFGVHMSSGLYARYVTTVSGSDTARVAKVSVGNTVITPDAGIRLNFYDPDMASDSLQFKVVSDSEVTMQYDVIVTLPAGGDYSWMSVKLDNGDIVSVEGNVITFSEVGEFSPNDDTMKEHTHTLVFSIKKDFQGNLNSYSNIKGGLTITVHAEQVD